VKITGVTSDSSSDDTRWQQLPILSVSDSFVKTLESEDVSSTVSSDTSDENPVKVACLNKATCPEITEEGESVCEGASDLGLSDEDQDFLDLLVDTLDGEFDPNLLL